MQVPFVTKEGITNPNVWLMMVLATGLGTGGSTLFDRDDARINAEFKSAAEREKAQWELIGTKLSENEYDNETKVLIADIKDYVDLKIKAECN